VHSDKWRDSLHPWWCQRCLCMLLTSLIDQPSVAHMFQADPLAMQMPGVL
jgi:hypothetical protein